MHTWKSPCFYLFPIVCDILILNRYSHTMDILAVNIGRVSGKITCNVLIFLCSPYITHTCDHYPILVRRISEIVMVITRPLPCFSDCHTELAAHRQNYKRFPVNKTRAVFAYVMRWSLRS